MSRRWFIEIEQHLPTMRRYARALTHHAADGDDLVQDALARACEASAQFDESRSLRSWLLAIVHNQFVSGRRRSQAEARRDAAYAAQQLPDSIEASQEHRAYLQQVAARFALLPEPQRAVLHLVAVEGLGYRETADALGIPIGTVMSRLSRARAALRETAYDDARVRLSVIGGCDVE